MTAVQTSWLLLATIAACSGRDGGSFAAPASSSSSGATQTGMLESAETGGAADDAASSSVATVVDPANDGGTLAVGADAAIALAPLPPMPANLAGPPHPWSQMNARQRAGWMEEHVIPAMGPMFHAYDATRFAEVRCTTCHGANPRSVNFRMPNPRLPQLHPWGTPEARHARSENPRMFEFMGERVVPAMAQLLGLPRFNPQTRTGFGCGSCHTYSASPAPAASATGSSASGAGASGSPASGSPASGSPAPGR